MSKTMLLALIGLAGAACAEPAGSADVRVEDESSLDLQIDAGGACTSRGNFDLEVFADEILPILRGEVDLNDPGGEPLVSCARGPCHAHARPGSFLVAAGVPPEQNLESFACFVDLERPRRSQVLVCASGDGRCNIDAHPGGQTFTPPDDLNYRRVLAYIRASRP